MAVMVEPICWLLRVASGRLFQPSQASSGLPDADSGLQGAGSALPEAGSGLPEASSCLPEASSCLPEAAQAAKRLAQALGGMYGRTDVQIPPVFYRTSSPFGTEASPKKFKLRIDRKKRNS